MIFASLVASITGKQQPEQSEAQSSETADTGSEPFENAETKQTISDVVSSAGATKKLPDQWKLKFDLRYDQSGDLTEVSIIHHPSHPAQFKLKPTKTHEPLEETNIAIESPNSANRHLTTTDEFHAACNIVKEYLSKIEERAQSRQSTEEKWNSAGPSRVQSQSPATA